MREVSFLQKVMGRLRSPLASVTECRHMTSFIETATYGAMATWYRAVSEALVYAVQYTVHCSVEGDIAEFGCQTGRTATAISAAMKLIRADKTLFLFDSFKGLPESTHETDRENEHVKSGVWGRGELKGISPNQLRKKCRRYLPDESIKIYEGWFSDSLPKVPAETKFSMLHIDCDLYQSTMDVLEHVFRTKSISEGAIFLFDDWDCNWASNEHGERRAWLEICKKYQVVASDGGGYGPACHKFIVHSYVV